MHRQHRSRAKALHQLLTHWHNAGASVPFTWATLRQQSTAGAEVDQLVRTVLGPLWMRWGSDDVPGGNDTLPAQMVLLLHRGLDALRTQYEVESTRDQAVASYASIRDGYKRQRASPIGSPGA